MVPEGDAEALLQALRDVLGEDEDARRPSREAAQALLEAFRWDRVLEPLVAFCREPKVDPTKARYAFRPPTRAPRDRPGFRLRRRLARIFGRRG